MSAAPAPRPWVLLGALNALYLGFGSMGGLIQGGLPAVLRAEGLGIGAASAVYVLYLPFGLAFLWAPMVDRWRPLATLPRLGWIGLMQGLAVVLLLATALGQDLPRILLLALVFLVAAAMATMDIALDALAVALVPARLRPAAAACKMAALGLGAVFGGGVVVGLFGVLGWMPVFLLVAAWLVLTGLPVLALARAETAQPPEPVPRAGLRAALRQPALRARLLVITLISCLIFALSGLNRLMLIDLGATLEQVGWIAGTLGPVAMLAAAGAVPPVMRRAGSHGALALFLGVLLAASGALLAGWTGHRLWLAMAGTVLAGAAAAATLGVFTALLLGWARGPQPATDYAAFWGISRLTATLATMGAGQLVAVVGWPAFYAAGVAGLVIAIPLLRRALPLLDPDAANPSR